MEVRILMVVSTTDEEAHIVEAVGINQEWTAAQTDAINLAIAECPCGDGGPWIFEGDWTPTEDEDGQPIGSASMLLGEWRRPCPDEGARWAHYGTMFKEHHIGPWWQNPDRPDEPESVMGEESRAIVAFGRAGACLLDATDDVWTDLEARGVDVDDALSHQDAVGSGNPLTPGIWAWEGRMCEHRDMESGVIDDIEYRGKWRVLTSGEAQRLNLGGVIIHTMRDSFREKEQMTIERLDLALALLKDKTAYAEAAMRLGHCPVEPLLEQAIKFLRK